MVIDALFVAPKHHPAVAAVLDGAVGGFAEGVAGSVLLELGLREAAADAVELDVAAAAVGVALLDEDEETTGAGDGGREGGEDEDEDEEDVEEWDKHTSGWFELCTLCFKSAARDGVGYTCLPWRGRRIVLQKLFL